MTIHAMFTERMRNEPGIPRISPQIYTEHIDGTLTFVIDLHRGTKGQYLQMGKWSFYLDYISVYGC